MTKTTVICKNVEWQIDRLFNYHAMPECFQQTLMSVLSGIMGVRKHVRTLEEDSSVPVRQDCDLLQMERTVKV